MLNELLALERGLTAGGLITVPRHPDLSRLLKGDVVRVRLNGDGTIDELELLEGQARPEVWTLRDGKHNGFPGLKTAGSLIVLDTAARALHDERWKAAKSASVKRIEIERLAAAAVLDTKAGDWPKPGHRARIADRLADLRSLEADPQTCAVPAAFERFLKALTLRPSFLQLLYTAILDRARNGEDVWLDVVRSALVGEIPLAIDVPRFQRDAGDERQIEAVSRALSNAGPRRGPTTSNEQICALTGNSAPLLNGNFPQPTLPSLGQTYLFSRNNDIRALSRYTRNGPSSMPVDADLAGRFSGALAAVTEERRRGKTWRLLPTEAGDRQDLFIAFIASAIEADTAKLLSETDDDDDGDNDAEIHLTSAQVEQAASRLLEFWKGLANKVGPGERARFLILRTVDPGNRKSVYDCSRSVGELHEAARHWAIAMRNAPDWISLPLLKAKKVVVSRPRNQSPLSLIALSRKVYIRGGRGVVDAPGIAGSEALALFLNEGDRSRRACRTLRLLLGRQTALLVGVAQANLRRQVKDIDPKARADALRTVSWIGALLFFVNPTTKAKEAYMSDVAFKLGQLLAAADLIHMGYCADRRGGDVPPSLLGASVFTAAGRDPTRAVGLLQQRIKPYIEWFTRDAEVRAAAHSLKIHDRGAEDKHTGKTVRDYGPKSGWTRGSRMFDALEASARWMPLARELSNNLVGKPIDEAFRAELLLGYVAGIETEKNARTTKADAKENVE